MALVKAANSADIAPGQSKTIIVQGRELGVYNVAGEFYCIDNMCPHAGGPIADGQIEGDVVYCPYHMWPFNVKTGEATFNSNVCVQKYECKIEGEEVFIEIG